MPPNVDIEQIADDLAKKTGSYVKANKLKRRIQVSKTPDQFAKERS